MRVFAAEHVDPARSATSQGHRAQLRQTLQHLKGEAMDHQKPPSAGEEEDADDPDEDWQRQHKQKWQEAKSQLQHLHEQGGMFDCFARERWMKVAITQQSRVVLYDTARGRETEYSLENITSLSLCQPPKKSPSKRSSSSTPANPAPEGLQHFELVLRPDEQTSHAQSPAPAKLPFALPHDQATEFSEVFNLHWKHWRQRKRKRITGLARTYQQLHVPFDLTAPQHDRLLQRLWGAVFDDVPAPTYLNRILASPLGSIHETGEGQIASWTALGFQNAEKPEADLNCLLELQHLVLYAETHQAELKQAVERQMYPIVLVGVIITQQLINMVRLPVDLQEHPERADRFVGSSFCSFLCSLDDDEGIHQVYTLLFELLHEEYQRRPDFSKEDFPNVLHAGRRRIESALEDKPQTFAELEVLCRFRLESEPPTPTLHPAKHA